MDLTPIEFSVASRRRAACVQINGMPLGPWFDDRKEARAVASWLADGGFDSIKQVVFSAMQVVELTPVHPPSTPGTETPGFNLADN